MRRRNRDDASARSTAASRRRTAAARPMQDPTPGGLSTGLEDETLASPVVLREGHRDRGREREWIIRTWAQPHLAALLTKFWKDDNRRFQPTRSGSTPPDLYMPRLYDSAGVSPDRAERVGPTVVRLRSREKTGSRGLLSDPPRLPRRPQFSCDLRRGGGQHKPGTPIPVVRHQRRARTPRQPPSFDER